jgi:uncharacterized protein (TIGR02246 family)
MKRLLTLCVAAAIALTVTACNDTDTHDADVKAVQANETQWNQDWLAKDSNKIMAHYADDAVLIVPGAPAVSGKDAIAKSLAGMLTDPALSFKFQAARTDVAKSGDLAYTQGSYTLTLTDPQNKQSVVDHGNYVTTYRKQPDGSWKAVADIGVSDVPPPAPPPPMETKGKAKPKAS